MESNTPQQATGHDLACSFRPKGRGIQPSRHLSNIRASAADWFIARGNKYYEVCIKFKSHNMLYVLPYDTLICIELISINYYHYILFNP